MKQTNRGRRVAVLVMLACILVSIPLGMHTTMARKDDDALQAFYYNEAGVGVADLLEADLSLGENLVRHSQVLLADMKGDAQEDSLRRAQEEMSDAYDAFAKACRGEPGGRAHAAAWVRAYNRFSGPMLRWLAAADDAVARSGRAYSTYETFRDKFLANHAALLGSDYNEAAQTYNLAFEGPVASVLRWVSFTGPLPLLEQAD